MTILAVLILIAVPSFGQPANSCDNDLKAVMRKEVADQRELLERAEKALNSLNGAETKAAMSGDQDALCGLCSAEVELTSMFERDGNKLRRLVDQTHGSGAAKGACESILVDLDKDVGVRDYAIQQMKKISRVENAPNRARQMDELATFMFSASAGLIDPRPKAGTKLSPTKK
jgi:hypothetical protein